MATLSDSAATPGVIPGVAAVRPATPADVPGIFVVRTAVRQNHLSLDQLAALGITPASVAAMIAAAPCAWVAEQAGRILGFSIVDLDDAALFAVFVLPGHEGHGLGRQLVARAETALFARHPTIWLITGRTTRAAGFYRALGWGDEQDAGEGDIRLEKPRPPASP